MEESPSGAAVPNEAAPGGLTEAMLAHAAGSPAPREWGGDEERALRVWITLSRCYFSVSRAVADRVGEYGLTRPQFGVLEALHHLGPLSLGELAEKLLVTGGNITYVMDRLESAGWVVRRRSSMDRRVIKAHLTAEGVSLVSQVFPMHASFIREVMDSLEISEQEDLRRLLKRLGTSV